jgi:hypothetical protein
MEIWGDAAITVKENFSNKNYVLHPVFPNQKSFCNPSWIVYQGKNYDTNVEENLI